MDNYDYEKTGETFSELQRHPRPEGQLACVAAAQLTSIVRATICLDSLLLSCLAHEKVCAHLEFITLSLAVLRMGALLHYNE